MSNNKEIGFFQRNTMLQPDIAVFLAARYVHGTYVSLGLLSNQGRNSFLQHKTGVLPMPPTLRTPLTKPGCTLVCLLTPLLLVVAPALGSQWRRPSRRLTVIYRHLGSRGEEAAHVTTLCESQGLDRSRSGTCGAWMPGLLPRSAFTCRRCTEIVPISRGRTRTQWSAGAYII